ncbi:MAG: peptidoglycan D,D-transpeptidase FtsI family protein [Nitriliruptorales bacterium]
MHRAGPEGAGRGGPNEGGQGGRRGLASEHGLELIFARRRLTNGARKRARPPGGQGLPKDRAQSRERPKGKERPRAKEALKVEDRAKTAYRPEAKEALKVKERPKTTGALKARHRERRRLSGAPTRGLSAGRMLALLVAYLLVFVAVGYRLVTVQVVRASDYAAIGQQQRERTIDLHARRGRIYDRDGDVLATSVDAATIYADPRAYRPVVRDGVAVPPAGDAREVAKSIASVLGLSAASIEARLHKDAHFVYVARQVDRELGERIRRRSLPGIGILTEPTRVNPAGPLAAQVLGFTGIDGEGLAGIELQYDYLLSGKPGKLALERAPGGLSIASADRELVPPVPGSDIVLTLDREIQHVAERAASAALERTGGKGVSVVVVEVGTGEVAAMASAPGFDPNQVETAEAARQRNRAVTDMFEPGSVQKAVTAAAALEEGLVRPDTVYSVGNRIRVGPKTFAEAHKHPTKPMTLRQIIEESSNVGTIQLALQIGDERLARYLTAFGYGRPLGLGFPGESSGSFPPLEDWSGTSLPTIAIGQGVAVTLLQAAHVYATLANDGVAVQPRLVRGTVGDDGQLVQAPPSATRRVVSAETARKIREMLVGVVNGERGTGKLAAVPGYAVGGKTGTARKPLEGARGYSGQYVASFVGLAPIEAPRFVVAVMLDEPTPIYGGLVAAPVFSEVMSFALAHRRVPPSDPVAPRSERTIPSAEPVLDPDVVEPLSNPAGTDE